MLVVSACGQATTSAIIPSPTMTMTSTLSPVATATPSPTLTPTAIPILSVDDAHQQLLNLLANNGNCHLPCLWGITPGKSTSQDAKAMWSPFNNISSTYSVGSSFTPEEGYVYPAYVEGSLRLETEVGYRSDNQIVNHIYFKAWEWKEYIASNGSQGLAHIFDSKTFGQRTAYYSLAHVLSEQGIPSSVMIITKGPPQIHIGGGGFDIVLLYPEQGIWAHYTTQMYVVGNTVKACPANAHIEMELYPPGNPDAFFALLDKTDYWSATKSLYKPLEEVTSMTVEQFYETFRNPTDKCIETPTNLWPTPEPGGG